MLLLLNTKGERGCLFSVQEIQIQICKWSLVLMILSGLPFLVSAAEEEYL